ncbi:MAG: hypothetical protein M3384_01940 [Acidobacteriota bacterium]|nr:hypothetical protein [Acidobacteriota bacterium]
MNCCQLYKLPLLYELPPALAGGQIKVKKKALAEIYLLTILLALAEFPLKQIGRLFFIKFG